MARHCDARDKRRVLAAAEPKLTERLQVWVTTEMRDELDALRREHLKATGHQLSYSDLGREGYILVLRQRQRQQHQHSLTA